MVSFIMYEYVWMGGCVLSTNFDENGRYFHFYDAASGKWIKGESRSLASKGGCCKNLIAAAKRKTRKTHIMTTKAKTALLHTTSSAENKVSKNVFSFGAAYVSLKRFFYIQIEPVCGSSSCARSEEDGRRSDVIKMRRLLTVLPAGIRSHISKS